jgi:flagellar biosynthesis regulator FlaF
MIAQYAAYQKVERQTLSDRKIQARVLRHAAMWLQKAKDMGSDEELLAALVYNMQFWTFVQADCLGDSCSLPANLQANLLSIASYMDSCTFKLIADSAQTEIIDSMMLINSNLAKGLEE